MAPRRNSLAPAATQCHAGSMTEIGFRKRDLPAPPHVVFEDLTVPNRSAARPWLNLLDDEIPPVVLGSRKPDLREVVLAVAAAAGHTDHLRSAAGRSWLRYQPPLDTDRRRAGARRQLDRSHAQADQYTDPREPALHLRPVAPVSRIVWVMRQPRRVLNVSRCCI
jgi:hypothetical protein